MWHACFGVMMPWWGGGVKAGVIRKIRAWREFPPKLLVLAATSLPVAAHADTIDDSHPTNMLAGTPIIAMRLLEDGALKFLTWVTRHPGCRSGPPAHFSQASAILGPLPG